jgi:ubiquinone/menaquinone biosynthesis C-methylase UbiE
MLDVATGTGDFAFEAIKILQPEKIIGVDISEGMLDVARKKIQDRICSMFFQFKWVIPKVCILKTITLMP